MHIFHPRLTLPNYELPQPRSVWAKNHAADVAQWPKTLATISDSRTPLINFISMKETVEREMGKECTAIEWVNEGGGNQIYLIFLKNDTQIIARIAFAFPHQVRTGEEFAYQEDHDRSRIPLRIQSEVATMRYVQSHTDIPIAKVFAYDPSLCNPIGAPYMLQEILEGDLLADRWNDMTPDERNIIIASLGKIVGQLYSLAFDHYGSLMPDGKVGPLVDTVDSLHRDYTLEDPGPWLSTHPMSPLFALAGREHQWLSSPAGQRLFAKWRGRMHPKEDVTKTFPAFMELTKKVLELIPYLTTLLPLPVEATRPTLYHPDFHYSNVLVAHDDPTSLTGIVDWEHAVIMPLWGVYSIPHKISDYGDKYEPDLRWREEKRKLRKVFQDAVVKTCPSAVIVITDSSMQKSIRGLRLVKKLATSGVALYSSCQEVEKLLISLRGCAVEERAPGVEILNHLTSLFSQLS